MNVTDALNSRLSVRDFLPTPIPAALIRQVLATASRAPSGGNVQPWQIDVLAGDRLDALKAIMQARLAEVAAGGRHQQRRAGQKGARTAAHHDDVVTQARLIGATGGEIGRAHV